MSDKDAEAVLSETRVVHDLADQFAQFFHEQVEPRGHFAHFVVGLDLQAPGQVALALGDILEDLDRAADGADDAARRVPEQRDSQNRGSGTGAHQHGHAFAPGRAQLPVEVDGVGQHGRHVDADHDRPRFAGPPQGDGGEDHELSLGLVDGRGAFSGLNLAEILFPTFRNDVLHGGADEFRLLAVGDDEALVADDGHRPPAVEQFLVDIFRHFLNEIEVVVRAGHAEEGAVDQDRDREGSQPDLLALHDVGEGVEHAFGVVLARADVPAALEHAVGVAVHGVVFHQGLDRDVSVLVAVPVRGEAARDLVVAVPARRELGIPSVEGVGFPAGIGAVEVGVVFQDLEQNAVDLVTAEDQAAIVLVLGEHEGVGHGARRVQGHVEFRLDLAGVVSGQVFQPVQRSALDQPGDAGIDQFLVRARRIHAVPDQDSRGNERADAGYAGYFGANRYKFYVYLR